MKQTSVCLMNLHSIYLLCPDIHVISSQLEQGWATQTYEGHDPAGDSDLSDRQQLTSGIVKE